MRFAIFSDIHANLEALLAVKADFEKREGIQLDRRDRSRIKFVSLGDVIGYGPRPNQSMQIIAGLRPDAEVEGNHEQGIFYAQQMLRWNTPLKKLWFNRTQINGTPNKAREKVEESYAGVNPNAQWAFRWTAENLSLPNSMHLAEMMTSEQYIKSFTQQGVIFAHACPLNPEHMNYIGTVTKYHERIVAATSYLTDLSLKGRISFVGHSHVPAIHGRISGGTIESGAVSKLSETVSGIKSADLSKYTEAVVVIGSVGQPRNHDPRAQYAVFDSDTRIVEFRFVEYDIKKTQDQMRRMKGRYDGVNGSDCPPRLIERLELAN